jgi:hypothetical protein
MHAIPGRDVDTGDGRGVEDRGVVDQHIETRAPRVQRFDDEFAGMGVGQILTQGRMPMPRVAHSTRRRARGLRRRTCDDE